MLFYSAKSHIKHLWNQIHDFTRKSSELKRKDKKVYSGFISTFENEIKKKKKLINALLDCYFDPEEDTEYISENKPLSREEQIGE